MSTFLGFLIFAEGALGSKDGVLEEHGDGHGAHAARNRGDSAAERSYGIELDISDEAGAAGGRGVGDAVDTDINDDCTGADVLGADVMRLANRSDEEVGLARDGGQVAGLGMGNGDGCIAQGPAQQQKQRHRLADDAASPNNDRMATGDGELDVLEQAQDAQRRAGDESIGLPQSELSDVEGVKTVHVFVRGNRGYDFVFMDVRGRGRLDEDAVDGFVGIELGNNI